MYLNNFFRLTKYKIIITIILPIVFLFIVYLIFALGSPELGVPLYPFGRYIGYLLLIFLFILNPFFASFFASLLLEFHIPFLNLFETTLGNAGTTIFITLFITLNIFYLYFLSCLIIYLYKEISKK